MKAAVRVNSLTLDGSHRSLKAMEDHGKRLDGSGKSRQVRDVAPLVYTTLDLRCAFDVHVAGAKMNAALSKPVLHMIIQFPREILTDAAPEPFLRAVGIEERKRLMLAQAIAFAQTAHGGDAVFAGRVDQDEEGELTVDLFLAPKDEKITATGKSSGLWISTTKHGKDLALLHQPEIRRRHPKARGDLTGPRQVGIALQEEFAAFFLRENGVQLTRKLKSRRGDDRLEVEVFKAVASERAEAEAKAKEVLVAAEAEAKAIRLHAHAEGLESGRAEAAVLIDQDRAEIAADRKELDDGFHELGLEHVRLSAERREVRAREKRLAHAFEVVAPLCQRVLALLTKASDLPENLRAEGKGLLRDLEETRAKAEVEPADNGLGW